MNWLQSIRGRTHSRSISDSSREGLVALVQSFSFDGASSGDIQKFEHAARELCRSGDSDVRLLRDEVASGLSFPVQRVTAASEAAAESECRKKRVIVEALGVWLAKDESGNPGTRGEILDLLSRLVACPSESPPVNEILRPAAALALSSAGREGMRRLDSSIRELLQVLASSNTNDHVHIGHALDSLQASVPDAAVRAVVDLASTVSDDIFRTRLVSTLDRATIDESIAAETRDRLQLLIGWLEGTSSGPTTRVIAHLRQELGTSKPKSPPKPDTSTSTMSSILTRFGRSFAIGSRPSLTTKTTSSRQLKMVVTPVQTIQGPDYVECLAWSPDGRTLAAGTWGHSVVLWRTHNWQIVRQLQGYHSPSYPNPRNPDAFGGTGTRVNSVSWRADSQTLATTDAGPVSLWRVSDGVLLRQHVDHHRSEDVECVAWSPRGAVFATSSRDRTIGLWRASDGMVLCSLEGHQSWVWDVAWSPDGTKLASASDDQSVRLWQIPAAVLRETLSGFVSRRAEEFSYGRVPSYLDDTPGVVLRILDAHKSPALCVAWSPDGTYLVTGDASGSILLWRASDGKLVRSLPGHSGPVECVAWSPSGESFASASHDGTVGLWRPSVGAMQYALPCGARVHAVSWSPAGDILAAGDSKGIVRIWSVSTETSGT